MAKAAAIFTVVVVFPTPPFWLETVNTRGCSGLGMGSLSRRTPTTVLGVVSRESSTWPS
ncbi:unannotated protein [freshwater metagenome]|uniref:Unannotated protein n=1 Tax=freshwater metagenome TaxID=449393 RepID=A0A6J6VY69_9ZZZZ